MYQAIEAICQAGQIVPLEPVQFEENEHLMIVRMPAANQPAPAVSNQDLPAIARDWQSFSGVLKDSVAWQTDPVSIQDAMRREWD